MKKNILRGSLSEMKKIVSNMPKTINESLDFDGEDMGMEEEPAGEPTEQPAETHQGNQGSIDVEKYIDDVRKTALKGMAQLADEPENWGYQTLKKLWQICDKKPEDGQQMQQQQNRPM